MTELLRRFRGLGIALAVLAISATVVFAAAPTSRVSAPTPLAEEPSESPEASEEPAESAEPSEAPKSDQAEETHGALVSTAAQMETPEGFANHGAFVSCVAHVDMTLAEVDWATVTPDSCDAASKKADKAADQVAEGKIKAESGRAKGTVARADHGKPTR